MLILIYVQYLRKAVFNFEKASNGQNHSSSGSHHLVKKSPSKISEIPPPLTTIWKTLVPHCRVHFQGNVDLKAHCQSHCQARKSFEVSDKIYG